MAATSRNEYSYRGTIFSLPQEDVIFQQIFSRLSIIQLFLCRRVNRLFKELCDAYFRVWKSVDFAPVANRMTESAFEMITQESTNLQEILVKHCKSWLRESTFVGILQRNHRLKKLDVTGCSSLTNVTLSSLAKFCCSLKELSLRECRWVSAEALVQLAMACNQLEFIDLTGCWQVNDKCVCFCVSSCTGLKEIVLNDCYSISNLSVEAIAKSCPGLLHIGIRGCWRVTNSAVSLIGEYCKELQRLEVKDCRDVTEISLTRLRVRGVQIDVERPSRMQRWIDHLDRGINNQQHWAAPALNLNI